MSADSRSSIAGAGSRPRVVPDPQTEDPAYRVWKEGLLIPTAVQRRLALEQHLAEARIAAEAASALPEFTEEPETADAKKPSLRIFDRNAVKARVSELERNLGSSSKSERSRQLAVLERLLGKGPDRPLQTVDRKALKALETLRKTFPNFGGFLDLVLDHLRLACLVRPAVLRLPATCLLGPPGIGKTAVIRRVMQILELPNRVVSCADVSAAFVVSGSTASWASSSYGFVAERLMDGSPANSCIVLDEIDKLPRRSNYPPDGPLYRLLEPTTAREFRDEYLDVDLDASRLVWLATANEADGIPEPIRSRLTMIDVQAPGRREMESVIDSVNEELRQEEPGIRKAFARQVPADVKELLLALPPRRLKKALLAAYARAASRSGGNRTRRLTRSDIRPFTDDVSRPRIGFTP